MRIGIESEVVGSNLDVALDISHQLGYKYKSRRVDYKGSSVMNHDFDDFTIKTESNSLEEQDYPIEIAELVFDPIDTQEGGYNQIVTRIQSIHDLLKARDFGGSDKGPVSIQLNLDVGGITPYSVLRLASSWVATHGKTWREERDGFLGPFLGLDEFRQREADDLIYRASIQKVFDWYFLEQLNELSNGQLDASAYENVQRLEPHHRAMVYQIVKNMRVRLSSWLIHALPEHPISKAIMAMQIVWDIPVVEFREFDQDFDVAGKLAHLEQFVHMRVGAY